MTKGKWTWAAVLAGGVAIAAAGASSSGAPSTRPATTKPSAMAHRKKLPKPFSEMTSLTPQQQDQIEKIHADAILEEKKLHEKETDDETALLTPEQQTEMSDVMGKTKEAAKEKYAAKRKAATQPTK